MNAHRWRRRLAALALIALLAAAVALLLDRLYPLPSPPAPSRLVVAQDGTLLRAFPAADDTWRYPVAVEQVSPVYLELLLAYEDRAFYRHPGINPLALLRALGQNLRAGRVVSGGSTLSMQVAGLLDPYPRTLGGKLRQMLRALQLEWHYSKTQILQLYLNQAPFGGMLSGVEAAARHYFGKPATELSDAEAALLTVLPQRPGDWRPDRYPQRAQRARDKVLQRMLALGLWPAPRVAAALQEPVAALPPQAPLLAPLLARRLLQLEPQRQRIETLIDADLQRQLQRLTDAYSQRLQRRQSLAVLVVRNRDLAVRAYVGSARFGDSDSQGFLDMTQAVRSPGSALKPFAYAMALDRGLIHSASLLLDTPRYGLAYRPHNFSDGFSGPVGATEALQRSLNLPAVQLVEHLGPERLVGGLLHAGLQLQGPGVEAPNSAVVLGGIGTTLESLTGVYVALGRNGLAGTPRLTPETPETARWLMSPGAAWIVWRMLAHDPWSAWGSEAGGWSLAWKTGTSYGFRDAWALGVLPEWTIGVWVGRPDASPSPGDYGRRLAAPLLFRVSELLPQQVKTLPRPDSVEPAPICWPLGTRAESADNAGDSCALRKTAWLLEGMAPATLSQQPGVGQPPLLRRYWFDSERQTLSAPACSPPDATLQPRTLALWPLQAEPWIRPEWRRAARLPVADTPCSRAQRESQVQIRGIEAGSRLQLPPRRTELSLALQLEGAVGGVQWYRNGEPLSGTSGNRLALLLSRPGRYRLSAVDSRGQTAAVEFSLSRFNN